MEIKQNMELVKPKNKYVEIKRSNSLMSSMNSLSLNSTKIWLLSIAALKWMDKENVQVDNGETTTILDRTILDLHMPALMQQQNSVRRLKEYAHELTTETIGIVSEDKNSWEMVGAYATRIKYENGKLEITHNNTVLKMIDAKSEYCEFFYNRILTLKSNYQIKTYDLCVQYIKIGKRTETIEFLRKFYNLENEFKQTSDFIKKIIAGSVNAINEDKNADIYIEFKTNKIHGKKIGSIEFNMRYKSATTQGLALQNKTATEINGIESLLKSIGISENKIKFLNRVPADQLLKAVKVTQKAITNKKLKNKSVEGYLIGVIYNQARENGGHAKVDTFSASKLLKEVVSITLWNQWHADFLDSLSVEESQSFAGIKTSENQETKKAIANLFNAKHLKWIYENKINNG